MKLKLPGLAMTAATALTATTVVTAHPQVAQAACLSASSCQVTITDGGSANGTYDITTISSPILSVSSILADEPWFGSSSLATEFANQVGVGLGFPNVRPLGNENGEIVGTISFGPLFTYSLGNPLVTMEPNSVAEFPPDFGGGVQPVGIIPAEGGSNFVFASATRVESVPEPRETAGLLGSGLLGLGFATIRRKRRLISSIKAQ